MPRHPFRIKICKNGPYLVSGGVPLSEVTVVFDSDRFACSWRKLQDYPQQERYSLCRCGQSGSMPFCDGTHTRIHFDGTETATQDPYFDPAKEIEGPTLRLTDAEELCMGVGFCQRVGGTWKLVRESDNPKARRLAIEQAGNCPAGRLVVWDKEGKAIEPKFEPSIALIRDPQPDVIGPLWVRGYIPIESADGVVYAIRNRVTLCRCGWSANKPFCDGSHVEHGIKHKHGG